MSESTGTLMKKSAPPSPVAFEAGMPASKLTLFDGISTIFSLMVGSGIFSNAGGIQEIVGSSGLALILWALTGVLALTGALWYIGFA